MFDSVTPYEVLIEYGVYTEHLVTDYYERDGVTYELNEDNKLIGLIVKQGKVSIEASTFINSYNSRSYSIGLGYEVYRFEYLSFGLSGGLIKGYENKQIPTNFYSDYSVYAAPYARLHSDYGYVTIRALGEAINASIGY